MRSVGEKQVKKDRSKERRKSKDWKHGTITFSNYLETTRSSQMNMKRFVKYTWNLTCEHMLLTKRNTMQLRKSLQKAKVPVKTTYHQKS